MFKYRGINEATKEKVYGHYAKFEGKDVIVTENSEVIPVEPGSVGVKVDVDKNGEEIYTGDKVYMKLYVSIAGENAAELEEDFEVIFSPSNYGFALAHEKLPDGFIMLDSLIYGLSEKAVLAKAVMEPTHSALFFFRKEYEDDRNAVLAVLEWLTKLMGLEWVKKMRENIVTGVSGIVQINNLTEKDVAKIEPNMPGELAKYLSRYGFYSRPKIFYSELAEIINGIKKDNPFEVEYKKYIIDTVNGRKHIFDLSNLTSLCGKEKIHERRAFKECEEFEIDELREYVAELANDGVDICPDCVAQLYFNGEG